MNPNSVVMDSPAKMLALFFGAGLAPYAPGTAGTLAAIPVYLLLTRLGPFAYLCVTAVVIMVGVWACGRAAHELGVHDHSAIVLDEVAGYLVTMALVPLGWKTAIAGFVLFRVFDVIKPWPIRWLDRAMPGGAGIMADDLAAGLAANAILWLLLTLLPI
ncbi:MAG: phosphatidylglycerophosphatase A [Proteobacteria bacterium]|nr:MAG: phosphatidylglycerophosphatase A [Pseudomonadota bacterium]